MSKLFIGISFVYNKIGNLLSKYIIYISPECVPHNIPSLLGGPPNILKYLISVSNVHSLSSITINDSSDVNKNKYIIFWYDTIQWFDDNNNILISFSHLIQYFGFVLSSSLIWWTYTLSFDWYATKSLKTANFLIYFLVSIFIISPVVKIWIIISLKFFL